MIETHGKVHIAVYFNQDLTDDELMKFVDNLLHEHPNVADYAYDHFPIHS